MTFEEILDHAIAMLQRRGRLTYRTLQRQFQLDDAALDDLKDELIYGQRLAADEDGRVLVWIGGAVAPFPQSAAPPLAATAPPPDAERRQLTVLFCDLVDSTRLAGQLDLEDWREVVRAYQQTCATVIQRFDGHIAQYLGDGLLVYFGYPQAHEEDAQHAVHAGLGMLDAMYALNARLVQDQGIRLALRIGMHTGLTIVGAIGGGKQEQLAMGDTPNIAARLQGVAVPDSVVMSAATYRLVQGYVVCDDLDILPLKGVAQPMRVYCVRSIRGGQSRLDIAVTSGLTPLVGREQEVGILLDCWEHVKNRQGQVVVLSGEAGIGKSRLVQVLKEHLVSTPHVRWECRCSPYYQYTALYPITEFFHRALQGQQNETAAAKLAKLEHMLAQYRLSVDETVPLFAPLLAIPLAEERYPPLQLSPQGQRQKLLETIVALLGELAERAPVLFILEEVHWADPSTLELLAMLIEHLPTIALYVLMTCRPVFQPPWPRRSSLTEVTLNRLSPHQVGQMAEQVAGGRGLPAEVLHQIIEKTDGVPLFVEELTKAILESGYVQDVDGHYTLPGPLPPFAIPATLQAALMARLDRLLTAKGIAQLGATMGRTFSYGLLQGVSQLNEADLQRELDRLVDAELLSQRGLPPHAAYTCKHVLIQETAYQSLLKSRRQQYHQQIAQVLEAQFPEIAERQPEFLAHHYTEAGCIEQAIAYWRSTGRRSYERSANVEAISYLNKGLALLHALPDTPERTQHELSLQTALGPALMVLKGYAAPEVERAYTRARALCQQVGETRQLFAVLLGLWNCHFVRGELQSGRELGEQLLSLAERLHEAVFRVRAHTALGEILFHLAEVGLARTHLEQGMALAEPLWHHSRAVQDPGVACVCYAAFALWFLGYPDQALQRSQEAFTLAQGQSHSFSLGIALCGVAWLHQFRREGQATQDRAEAAITLATEQGFTLWVAMGTIFRGWALAAQGQSEDGLRQIHQGMTAWRTTGAELLRPYWLAVLAEVYGNRGQTAEGLHILAEGLAMAHHTGERFYAAELYRVKGELLLQQSLPDTHQAAACLQQALAIARRQQAHSLELRAAMSLSRLWQQQGKRPEARELLAPVYGWFTEGFDTADLQEAKALLVALR